MKVSSIKLENFAKYANVDVSFDDNVTYLVGGNGSGKSTLGLNAIWFMFQGIAEKASGGNTPLIGERFRFIGPSAPTAKGEMVLFDETKGIEIKVLRKLTKSGSELTFEAPQGIELNQQWLNDLFNIFLLSPKKFTELSGREQAKLLGIDTNEIDTRLKEVKSEFTLLNRDLKQYEGLKEVEKVDPVDVADLNKQKNEIIEFNALQDRKTQEHKEVKDALEKNKETLLNIQKQIEELKTKEKEAQASVNLGEDIVAHLAPVEDKKPTEEIDKQINEASVTNLKATQYTEYLKNKKAKEDKEAEIKANKAKQVEIEKERIEFIQSKKLPFKNLTVGEEAELLLDGKPIKEPYFSTGELIKLIPILLASQNQELKYVYIQDFNMLDEDNQNEIEKYLTSKGFQLVIEYVGKEAKPEKNCILLKDNQVISEDNDERETIKI